MINNRHSKLTPHTLKRLKWIGINSHRERRLIAGFEFMVALGIIMFWIAFFTIDMVNISDPGLKDAYLAFESAFPFADLYLALILIIGGIGLWNNKFYGFFFSLIGGASLLFLGMLDVSFNVQNGMYSLSWEETVLNVFINCVCLGFGLYLLLKIWKHSRIGKTEILHG